MSIVIIILIGRVRERKKRVRYSSFRFLGVFLLGGNQIISAVSS